MDLSSDDEDILPPNLQKYVNDDPFADKQKVQSEERRILDAKMDQIFRPQERKKEEVFL